MQKKIMAVLGVVAICIMMTATVGWTMRDNSDGTITDGNLVWLKDANCFGKHGWYEMTDKVGNLQSGSCGLKDKSFAGQWRLPTTNELLARYANKSGFHSIKEYYWSSTDGKLTNTAYIMDMLRGYGNAYLKTDKFYGWPVRSIK